MACALDVVLRAAGILKQRKREDIVFLLVGEGATREDLQGEARRLGLDNVVFAGRQDKSRVPHFFSITDVCLIHLKKTDLFATVTPSKLFEAGGMARPVIMGVEGCAAEMVESAHMGLLIEPENENDLVDALLRLADDAVLANALGHDGYDYVVGRFDREKLAEEYLRLIQTVAYPARS